MEYGNLNINVVSENTSRPVEGATIRITGENAQGRTIEEARTNAQGQLNDIEPFTSVHPALRQQK